MYFVTEALIAKQEVKKKPSSLENKFCESKYSISLRKITERTGNSHKPLHWKARQLCL